MKKAPVLLMTYIRPKNTNFLLNLLFKFNQDKIFVFNDGLNNLVHKDLHQKTRKIILDFKKK